MESPPLARWKWTTSLTVPACAILGALVGGATLQWQKPRYQAVASLERASQPSVTPPPLIGRETLKRFAPDIVRETVSEHRLEDHWHLSPEKADDRLLKTLSLRGLPDGSIQLSVTNDDSTVAASLANALAQRVATLPIPAETDVPLYWSSGTIAVTFGWDEWQRRLNATRTAPPAEPLEKHQTLISSPEIMGRVAENLKLSTHWLLPLSAAIERLMDRVRVEQADGTGLVTVSYGDEDAALARDIASEIITIYMDDRKTEYTQQATALQDILKKQLKDQAVAVEDARLKMLDLAERYHLVDLATVSGEPDLHPGQIVTTSHTSEQMVEIKRQYALLKDLDEKELIKSAAMIDTQGGTLQQLWPEYQKMQLVRQGLLDSGLGENHPRVKEAIGQLEATFAMLLDQARLMKTALSRKYEMVLNALESNVTNEAETGPAEERRKVAAYQQANRDYQQQRETLGNLQSKYATQSVDLMRPHQFITLHEAASLPTAKSTHRGIPAFRVTTWAQPNDTPLPRSLAAALGWGGGIGLFLGLLLAVPLMWVFERLFDTPPTVTLAATAVS